MPEFEYYDAVVIGGGILGCFAARNLRSYDMSVVLVESREDLCTGISRANTAAVYAGYDTKPGTVKTELCVSGGRSFEDLCARLGVRYKNCGSIMVCFGPRGEKVLRKKFDRGVENGVEGMKLLSKQEILTLEPELSEQVHMGLYCPVGGTVDPWELGLAAAENFVSNGGKIYLNSPVSAIEKMVEGYLVTAGEKRIKTRGIVNCAGLYADEVRELVFPPHTRIFPEKCDYVVLDTTQCGKVNHVIFYEPEEKGKGLTVVPTVDGNILIGGSTIAASDKEDNPTTGQGLEKVLGQTAEIFPNLNADSVIRSFAAVRPNPWPVSQNEQGELVKEDVSINDFTVIDDGDFISLVGIKTPGLTCSQGLGELVAKKVAAAIGKTDRNPEFDPTRQPEVRFADLSRDRQAELIAADHAWGRIVCHCRNVTEAEIINAIKRGAVTVDGVKRRTGAGMGRCQGSGCSVKIMELIARESGISADNVKKDSVGSEMIYKR